MGWLDESRDCEWCGCELMLDAEDLAINRVSTRVTSCYECIKFVRICYSAFPLVSLVSSISWAADIRWKRECCRRQKTKMCAELQWSLTVFLLTAHTKSFSLRHLFNRSMSYIRTPLHHYVAALLSCFSRGKRFWPEQALYILCHTPSCVLVCVVCVGGMCWWYVCVCVITLLCIPPPHIPD